LNTTCLEYPTIKAFAVNPGRVYTPGAKSTGFPKEHFTESPELCAATMLKLTSGNYDWLNAKYAVLCSQWLSKN
jgi:hypothetical protein